MDPQNITNYTQASDAMRKFLEATLLSEMEVLTAIGELCKSYGLETFTPSELQDYIAEQQDNNSED